MFGLSALDLARVQFAFTMSFHILFPAITIGMASYLAVLELCWLRTGRQVYVDLYHYWLKIFAVTFGMGVVSGIVMAYQIGTNWSYLSEFAGSIMGPILSYEVLTAFFLEAGFLGVMLFGWTRVGPGLHFAATCAVAVGTLISATWILAANSWMQTPQGYAIEGGRMVPADWLAIVFNPSFPYRLAHNVTAFYITTGFVVLGVGAYLLRGRRFVEEGRVMLSMALWLLTILVPLQIFLGDEHGLNTLKYQPAKLAAIEAHWETAARVPLILFAVPEQDKERNDFVLEIPVLGSLILAHDPNGVIRGLKEWPEDQRPPVAITFYAFRVMVGIGFLMLAVVAVSWWLRLRDRLFESDWYLRLCEWMAPLGFVAVLAGWTTTEVGRQPWTVYGLLRTADSVSPSLTGTDVLISLLGYAIVYLVMFPTGLALMARIVRRGPERPAQPESPIESGRPFRPVEALPHGREGGVR
jgi:cytochrome d ubiquinol oxidase subunit I